MQEVGQDRPHSVPPKLPPGLVRKIVFGAVILLILLIGTTMFYTVQEQERAVILTFGKYDSTVDKAGLHFKMPAPIQKVIKVDANRTQKMYIGYRESGNGAITSVPDESLMITGDENIVSADAVVEWRVSGLRQYLFNIDDPQGFLRNSAISAIRSVIGSTKLDYAITEGKTEIQGKVKERLIDMQKQYDTGIQILDLKFQDIEPPEGEVQQAFKEVTNAREEKNTKINNANKYMNDRIPKARGEAQALIEDAEAQKASRILNAQGDVAKFNAIYAEYKNNPGVTKERLILETLEKVLPGSKIIITDGNGDTVKYLPVNELFKSEAKPQTPKPEANGGGGAQ